VDRRGTAVLRVYAMRARGPEEVEVEDVCRWWRGEITGGRRGGAETREGWWLVRSASLRFPFRMGGRAAGLGCWHGRPIRNRAVGCGPARVGRTMGGGGGGLARRPLCLCPGRTDRVKVLVHAGPPRIICGHSGGLDIRPRGDGERDNRPVGPFFFFSLLLLFIIMLSLLL